MPVKRIPPQETVEDTLKLMGLPTTEMPIDPIQATKLLDAQMKSIAQILGLNPQTLYNYNSHGWPLYLRYAMAALLSKTPPLKDIEKKPDG